MPTWDRTKYGKVSGVAKGAYVLVEESRKGEPDVIIVATGSEVQLAVQAAEQLEKSKVATRVVSMPCREWFEKQTRSYQDKVLPPAVRARVSVEAAVSMGWHDVVGDAGRSVSIEHFGASADQATLFREFGITADAVVKAAKDSLKAAGRPVRAHGSGVTETNPRRAAQSAVDRCHGHRRGRQRQGLAVGSIRHEQGEVNQHVQPEHPGPLRRRRLDLARRPVARAARDRQDRRPRQGAQRRRPHLQPLDLPGRPVQG